MTDKQKPMEERVNDRIKGLVRGFEKLKQGKGKPRERLATILRRGYVVILTFNWTRSDPDSQFQVWVHSAAPPVYPKNCVLYLCAATPALALKALDESLGKNPLPANPKDCQ